MNRNTAIEALAALAQETRLEIFKLLVTERPGGLRVSEISRRLDIVPSTLSGHLGILKHAGLLTSSRHKREVHYSASIDTMSGLIRYMLEDCCKGQAEDCLASLETSR